MEKAIVPTLHMASQVAPPLETLRHLSRRMLAPLMQPLVTVGMLVFLYAGWHVRDEGGVSAGLRVAFVDTRAFRAEHENEREAALLQAELRRAAETDKQIDEALTRLLIYAPLAARVRLNVVHNGITGVTGVALLRVDVTNAVASAGHSVGPLVLNQPLSDFNNFLPVLLAGKCYLGTVSEQPSPALRGRLEALGVGTFMVCPVNDNRNRMLGATFVMWDTRDLAPTGDILQSLMKYALETGTQIAAAIDLRARKSPRAGSAESQ